MIKGPPPKFHGTRDNLLYMVDLVCDPGLLPFYARLGLQPYCAAILRNHAALAR
jgi:hypothetical protein